MTNQSSSFGLIRVAGVDGRTIVVACADNQATAHYVARLPWGAGTPIALAEEDCTIIAAQRTESAQLARASANTTLIRENTVFTPSRPLTLNRNIIQFQALNNDADPWHTAGGISSATCPTMSDAARIHELLITELGAAFPGIPVAVGNEPCPCGSGAKYKRCCGR